MKGRKKISKEEAEVESLLKSVEDEMLLKLSLDSHMSRVSPNYIHSDLDRRLHALKSTKSHSTSSSPNPPPPAAADPELVAVLGDDLAARFAALRTSLPTKPESAMALEVDEEDEEDDEVEMLIRWAKDAARLDPSPPSDDDLDGDDVDDDDGRDDDDDDDDDDEDDRSRRAK